MRRTLTEEHKAKISNSLKGIKRIFTKEHRLKLSEIKKDAFKISSNHPQWKGDKASYRAIHAWIVKHYGKPTVCEDCKTKNLTGHKIHWANINDKYKRDIKDWKRLCVKCHGKFDTIKRKLIKNK